MISEIKGAISSSSTALWETVKKYPYRSVVAIALPIITLIAALVIYHCYPQTAQNINTFFAGAYGTKQATAITAVFLIYLAIFYPAFSTHEAEPIQEATKGVIDNDQAKTGSHAIEQSQASAVIEPVIHDEAEADSAIEAPEDKVAGAILLQKLRDATFDQTEGHFASFECNYGLICKFLGVTRAVLQTMTAEGWQQIGKQLGRWAAEVAIFREPNPYRVTWITGTCSSALIGIARVAKKRLAPAPALASTGQLLHWNIVPLAGELAWGVFAGGTNHFFLSGVPIDSSYEAHRYSILYIGYLNLDGELKYILTSDKSNTRKGLSRLKIAVLRLIHMGASSQMLKEAKKYIQDKLLWYCRTAPPWEKTAPLIGVETKTCSLAPMTRPRHPASRGTLVSFKSSNGSKTFAQVLAYNDKEKNYTLIINRLGKTQEIQENEVDIYKQEPLHAYAQTAPALSLREFYHIKWKIVEENEYKEDIESILQLFETETPLEFTSEERPFIQNSFPIIWGTTSETPLEFHKVHSDRLEYGIEQVLHLGSEIKVAFTEPGKITTLKRWLRAQNVTNVQVLSLGAMAYLSG